MNTQSLMDNLSHQFIHNGFKRVRVETEMGDCYVTPMLSYYDQDSNLKISEVEYYLVEGPIPWMSSSNFSEVCDNIVNIKSLVEENNKEKEELSNYYNNTSKKDFDYDWYSDWYKDVYGYRPRG